MIVGVENEYTKGRVHCHASRVDVKQLVATVD